MWQAELRADCWRERNEWWWYGGLLSIEGERRRIHFEHSFAIGRVGGNVWLVVLGVC